MDYVKKLERMDEHLRQHPHDYQTVISRMKTASDAVEYSIHLRKVTRLKRLAEIRKQMKEKEDGRMQISET